MAAPQRIRSLATRRVWVVVLLLVGCAVVAIEAWFPLGPKRSHAARDAPVVADGTVAFRGRSVLVSPTAPDWLAAAIDSGRLDVHLSFNASSSRQDGPARLLAITHDVHHADLMIGQEGTDLVVRVRRTASDPSGDPAFIVSDAIRSDRWQQLTVSIADGRLHVILDARTVIDELLSPSADHTALSSWDPAYQLTLGDELDGDREWHGRLRDVSVVTSLGTTDLLAPGDLRAGTGTVEIVRDRTILRPPDGSPLFVVLRLLIFVPIGIALGLLLPRSIAISIGLALPLLLALGKRFVDGRHAGLTEIVVGVAGTLIGVGVAWYARRDDHPRRAANDTID
jgi:hypothetical protein